MQFNEIKNILFEKALKKGFEDCEIYYVKGNSFSINIYKGEIEKYQNNENIGLSFRGIINGKAGYSYTENIDKSVFDFLIESAISNAEIIGNNEKEFIYKGDENYSKADVYCEDINSLTIEDKINIAKRMEKAVLNYSPLIKSSNNCSISNGEQSVFISNTKGLNLSEKSNYLIAYASASANNKTQVKNAGEIYCGNLKNLNPKKIGETAAIKAISYLYANSVKSGKYNVIFKNDAFSSLVMPFIGNFYAENVQKGFSLLKGKIGKKIASDIITIKDLPLLKEGLASCSFDSEGVSSKDKCVIENGVLKTYLYNLKSANIDGVSSTGNGFKSGFKSNVSTSATNFYIKESDISYNKLLKNMGDGIVITELSGLHSGTDSISGDFSLAAEGFLIKDGSIEGAIEQITVAGNFYELLKNIKCTADDIYYSLPSSNGSVCTPSVFAGMMDIAGL